MPAARVPLPPACKCLFLLAGLLAVAPAGAREEAAPLFERLEQSLLAAQRIQIESQARTQGLLKAELSGALELGAANRLRLRYVGDFGGQAQTLELDADAVSRSCARNGERSREPTAAESNRALIVGFTRMGLMHNLARLTRMQGPDHAEGGVADWVQVSRLRYLPPRRALAGPTALALAFDIQVAGQPAGSAVLWLDEETELPVKRMQIVRFERGEMAVEETYSKFLVE